jgi:hypothetical protein
MNAKELFSKRLSSLHCHQHHVLCNCGSTEEQSSSVHIQTTYQADGIRPGIGTNTQLLIIKLASVRGRQLINPQLHKASIVMREFSRPKACQQLRHSKNQSEVDQENQRLEIDPLAIWKTLAGK